MQFFKIEQNIQKKIRFLVTCIWTGYLTFSLLQREYLS